MHELLNRYVDEQTPSEAPPFEYVERAARGQKTRNRVTATLVTTVVVAGAAALAVVDRPRADQAPAGPETVVTQPVQGILDDGPPPERFRYGRTEMLLSGEVRITSVTYDPAQPTVLTVNVPKDLTSSYACLPDTVVRILSQDDKSVRIAAYRYRLGAEQDENQTCDQVWMAGPQATVPLNLRSPVGIRTVYAGAAGQRILQY
jgi:hypothetical protein